jgi:hypothetical protein
VALTTYAGLKASIASWLHRSDLTAVIPDFISLAESQIRRDVRCRAMEQSATGTLTSTSLAFPTRMAEVLRVALNGDLQRYLTPNDFQGRTGEANQYTIVGETFVFQSSTATYAIDYYQWFAALADDADTNWVLTNFPEIYLFGALAEAKAFVVGDPTQWQRKYAEAVSQLRRHEQKAKYGSQIGVRVDSYV